MDVKEMITRKIIIDRVVEDGILALTNEKERDIKILIDTSSLLRYTSILSMASASSSLKCLKGANC